ncbi:MAG: cytochrome b [Pikeienuella sp.]
MGLRNSADSWGWLARLLHWTIAGIVLFLLGLGIYMTRIMPEMKASTSEIVAQFQVHKSWGFTVFVLVVLRLIWRAVNPTPELPAAMSRAERFLAKAGHLSIYALLFAIPITGWLMVSSSPFQDFGIPNKVFGLFDMPDPFVPGDKDISALFSDIHFACVIALTVVLVGHIGAALKHHFIERDNVLRRMITGR